MFFATEKVYYDDILEPCMQVCSRSETIVTPGGAMFSELTGESNTNHQDFEISVNHSLKLPTTKFFIQNT